MTSPDCSGPDGTCQCVASPLLELLGSKYAMDVLCVIGNHEPVRFSTVEDHVADASTSTLSTRLDELAEAGLLERERYDEIPPRVEYRLSDEGSELGERLRPLFEWIARQEGAQRSEGQGQSDRRQDPADGRRSDLDGH